MDSILKSSIENEILSIINNMGFEVVELKLGFTHKLVHIILVIYSKTGIGTGDCSRVHKAIYPQLELLEGLENFSMEVTSPGISRLFKSNKEFVVFKNKGVKLLLENGSEWLGGVINDIIDNKLSLLTKDGLLELEMNEIKKAKLDHTQEVY